MQENSLNILPLVLGLVLGVAAFIVGLFLARRSLAQAGEKADRLLGEARLEAENKRKEILVEAQERHLAQEEEFDRQEREIRDRESQLDQRARDLEKKAAEVARDRKSTERHLTEAKRKDEAAQASLVDAEKTRDEAHRALERVSGLTLDQARAELIAGIEEEARAEGARLARKIEDEIRENLERDAVDLMVRASQNVNLNDVLESTVSFIELPSDEMKGRIIGREGRNIRALEMATGIDLIVDDTPRSILISSFDPLRREVARVAIDRLVEDGRIHPARIEEVVQKVNEEVEELIQQAGTEAAYGLGISDLHPKLGRLVGRMRYHTSHGQNLLQHCLETAMIGAHMAQEVGAPVELVHRAALLHEVGQVVDGGATGSAIHRAAEVCAKYGESEAVVQAIRTLSRDVEPRTAAELLLSSANRMSDNRPGARKENLAVYVERLKRLESIATDHDEVARAYAVKAGKEIRVIVDAEKASDHLAAKLCKQIARAVERELSYPGQIKVHVIRETRSIRFAV